MGSQIVGHDLAIEQQLIYYIAVRFLFVPPNCLLPCPFFSLPFLRLNPGGSDGKVSACNAGDPGSIPGLGRSPGEGNGNPLQHSCLENPMDGGA